MGLKQEAPRTRGTCMKVELADSAGQVWSAGAVAVGGECMAFRCWVDELPSQGNEAILQLRQYGFTYDLRELEAQLRRALRQGPAGPLARLVGQRVLAILAVHGNAGCFLLGLEQHAGARPE
jgi:hypothetical protein